ncbi:MAG: HAMP domain-containing histidine kinase [Lachnospiraceae bacterium]|nr:HAMP domain-containing histidine kinase [Lachnospiraceae bacterium]
MEQEKKLQIFLIKKFIIVMLVVGIVETGALWVVNHNIVPYVLKSFFPGYDRPELINMATLLILLFTVIAATIVGIFEIIIPEPVRTPISWLSRFLQKSSGDTIVGSGGEEVLNNLNRLQQTELFLILVGVVLMLALPYALGVLYYTRVTMKEFRKIAASRVAARKEYERRRNLMLSDIAHDLRTPITTVAGYSKALSDGMVSEDKKQEYLDSIMAKSVRMNDLIQLLFDYVKLDSEGFELNRQTLDICELVRECGAMLYPDIEDAGMGFDADIPEVHMKINADKVQLSRVITNLITNAIKHNDKGDAIGIFVVAEDDRILVMVADTGKRIPEDKALHLFEPFTMGDESRNSRGGSGLGLSIAKKIVEMHGYKIKLVQQPDIARYKKVDKYEKMFMITIPIR